MNTRLYRSRRERMIGGVCGGLGLYLGIDPILIRLLFVLVTLAGGAGVLIYILMLIVVPENPDEIAPSQIGVAVEEPADAAERRTRNALFGGGFLILLGLLFLLQNLNIPLLNWFNMSTLWPILLIAGGLVLLWRYYQGEN